MNILVTGGDGFVGVDVEYMEEKPEESMITLCIDELPKQVLGWETKKNIEEYIQNYLNV